MSPDLKDSSMLPVRRDLTLIYAISLVVATLMAIASVAGFLVQSDVYPTDELVEAFVPNDGVNLVIGLPILLGSMWLARRGRLIGLLLWPGALFYVFYTYVIYVFAVPLNAAFLLHLALLTLSAYTMIALVANINGEAVRDRLTGTVPERAGGGVLVGLGLLFLVRVIGVMVGAILDETPIDVSEHALNVTDFMLTPSWIIGGLLLWRRRALGYVTGLGLLFQASMLFIGLVAILILRPFITETPFALVDVLVVAVMGLVSFIPLALYVRGVRG